MSRAMNQEQATERLQEYVRRGREKSAQVVQTLQAEAEARRDVIVPRGIMRFVVRPDNVALTIRNPELPQELGFTRWSQAQMLETLGIPGKFLQGLQGDGEQGSAIATTLMNDLLYRIGQASVENRKRLLRIVEGVVKGWLSPSYAIIDQGQLLQGFAAAIATHADKGIAFTDGTATDRRYAITAIWPQVFTPWEGEALVVGVQLHSSDYGFGAVDLRQEVIRLICLNGAVGVSFFRKVHIGGSGNGRNGYSNGDSEPLFTLSERTRQLSAATVISMMTDAIAAAFSEQAVNKVVEAYRAAAARTINPDVEAKDLRDAGVLSKDEATQVSLLVNMDIEQLPDTPNRNSALRFGQLLAWLSTQGEIAADNERALVLQQVAGRYFLPASLPNVLALPEAPEAVTSEMF